MPNDLASQGWHYSPDLTGLLVETIPRLVRSKWEVISFFQHAGVPSGTLSDLERSVRDKEEISKFQIARTIIERLNQRQDNDTIRQRRDVIRRVVEWEDFSRSFPDDQAPAKGLVADLRHLVNVKDSFTRMDIERQKERSERLAREREKAAALRRREEEVDFVRKDLNALFTSAVSPQTRGKSLEGVLNRLFAACGISVREAFARTGQQGEGVIEQVDGVVEVDRHLCLVEMKWMKDACDKGDVSEHLVRLFGRDGVYGIFISASGYTKGAVATCRDSLPLRTSVLIELRDIVLTLERHEDLVELLRERIRIVQLDREPLARPGA